MSRDLAKRVVEIAKGAFALALVGWLVYYLVDHRDRFRSLLDVSWYQIAGISVGILVVWFISGAQTRLLLRTEGVFVGLWEMFLLTIAASMLNYLPMRVGTILQLRYLKVRHGVRYARFGSMTGVRLLLLVFSTAVLGLVGSLGMWLEGGRPSMMLVLVFSSMLTVSVVVFYLPLPIGAAPAGRLGRIWADFAHGVHEARSRRRLLSQVAGLILVHYLALAARMYLTFLAIGIEVSPWFLMILAPLTIVVSLTSLTMGALGIREGIIGYVSFATGHDFSAGIFAGADDRAVQLALTFSLGSVALLGIRRRLAEAS